MTTVITGGPMEQSFTKAISVGKILDGRSFKRSKNKRAIVWKVIIRKHYLLPIGVVVITSTKSNKSDIIDKSEEVYVS